MRFSNPSLLLMLALALPMPAQVVPPSLGLAGRAGHAAVDIQGLPGSWIAVPATDGPLDSAASSPAQRCWVREGELNILQLKTGVVERFPVATGGTRFAFDANGALSALLSLRTGEVYSASAGWKSIFTLPNALENLDLTVSNGGVITVLYRARHGLRRTRIDESTGSVLSDMMYIDRRGPALLGANGLPVYASDSGLTGVESMQRVDRGWMLLSTPRSLWLWQPGKSPQAVPVASAAAPVLQIWPFNGTQDVGDTIAFPDTPPGYVTKLDFLIVNTGVSDLDITTIHLTTAAPFKLVDRPSVPWLLQAGKFATLSIQFAPSSSGTFVTSLTLNDRSIDITGNASGSATPLQPTVALDQSQLTSNQSAKVSVKLNHAASSEQTGVLSLTFTPASTAVSDDPAIQLTGNQQVTRAQQFKVPAGSDTAVFGADSFVTLNTGTTAGSVTLKAALGLQTGSQTLALAPAAPTITSAVRKTTTDGMVLVFQGFDNTHSISGLTFTFYTSAGAVVSPGAIAVDASQDFSKYYQANTQVGGNFQVTATFPVSGDISAIASASVVFKNSEGTTTAKP